MTTTPRGSRDDWDSQWYDWEKEDPVSDEQYRQWLRNNYVPLAGEWHY